MVFGLVSRADEHNWLASSRRRRERAFQGPTSGAAALQFSRRHSFRHGMTKGTFRSGGKSFWEIWGAHFDALETILANAVIDFLSSSTKFATDFSRIATLRHDENRIHTMRNTQGVTTTIDRRLRTRKFATKLAQETIRMLPNASKYECFSSTPGSARVAAGLPESADPEGARRGGQDEGLTFKPE